MITGPLALIAASAFTGAAAYINAVEQPARIDLPAAALLREWAISYKRGTVMQVSLAVLSAALGIATFVLTHDARWLAGALIMLVLLPYSIFGVFPTNRKLQAMSPGTEEGLVRAEVLRWGRLHAIRTLLGAAASVVFLWALA